MIKMPRPKRQKLEIDDDQENDRLENTTKKTLMIPQVKYSRLLRRDCKHNNYVKAYYTLRKQHDDFLDTRPSFVDFNVGTETFYFDLPYPITTPYLCEEEIDFCAELFKDKMKYRDKLRNYTRQFKSDQKWLTKKYVEETKYAKLPKYIIDLSVGNIKDPDEQFEGIYNWYYTGGILSSFYTRTSEYLMCPLPNNHLKIINMKDYNDVETLESDVLNLNLKPILNLQVENDKNGDKVIVIRQRNSINVFHLLGDDDFSLLHMFKVITKNRNPFLDVTRNSDIIAYLEYNRKLNILNMDNDRPTTFKFQKTDLELSDPFCQVEYLDENTIGFIDRNTLRFLDVRSFNEQVFEMNDKVFLCDDLCYIKQLNDSPYLFLATIHNIKKFDMRANKIVKTWSHMLAGQPSMLKIEKTFYGDLVFLSSEKYNERVLLSSNEEESNLVQLVPHNYETLKKCNLIDFDLNTELYENRLKFSTAGIEIIQNKKDLSIHTCNTLGDVFQINVRNYQHDIEVALSQFGNWRQHFKWKPKPCIVTHLRDMSYAKFILQKPIRRGALEKYTKPNRKRSEYIAEYSIEDSPFAHIWITDENATNESLAPTISANSKVSDWLEGVNSEVNEEE